MRLPPLQPMSETHFYVSGNVTIHPSAAIAPGVFLQADPDSQITIAAGVCIGMGSILRAHQGMLEIEVGANLGAGVLMVGSGKIGENACVGSKVTIINASVEPEQVIQAGSLIGESGRAITQEEPSEASIADDSNGQVADAAPTIDMSTHVYGRAAFNQLMIAIFPNSQPSNRISPTPPASSNDTPSQ